jgi:hypothetical protein
MNASVEHGNPPSFPLGRHPQKDLLVAAVYLVVLARKALNPAIPVNLRRIPNRVSFEQQ